MLLESVGFMDALDAANIKTEPRKRKRKLSTTKESNGGPEPKKEASPTGASGDSDSPKVPISPPIVKPQFKVKLLLKAFSQRMRVMDLLLVFIFVDSCGETLGILF